MISFLLFLLSAVLVAGASWLLFSFGAPYAASRSERISDLTELLDVQGNEKVVDLGAGDGRVLVALARVGAREAHGYEINPLLASRARKLIRQENLQDRVFIHQKSFWSADLSPFDIIIVYGIGPMMRRLEWKLQKELRPGARIASVYFKLPNWQAEKRLRDITLYVQRRDEHNGREKDEGP